MSHRVRFQKVLAVCSGNSVQDCEVLALAARIAAAHGAELSALSVVPRPSRHWEGVGPATPKTIEERLRSDRHTDLDRLVRTAVPDHSVTTEVRVGKTFVETILHAIAGAHDLVIKTAEELGGWARYLLASTDQHLLRKCPATVWLLRPTIPVVPRCVLASVDVDYEASEEPETEAELNRRIVAQAQAIADWAGATLHLLSVWDGVDEGLLRAWGSPDDGKSYLETLESRQWNRLGMLAHGAAQAGSQSARQHVERGWPRNAIPEAATRLNADLLVMGTVARTGMPGLIIGNTAEDVLNNVRIPVVAVKPPGYASPLAGEP